MNTSEELTAKKKAKKERQRAAKAAAAGIPAATPASGAKTSSPSSSGCVPPAAAAAASAAPSAAPAAAGTAPTAKVVATSTPPPYAGYGDEPKAAVGKYFAKIFPEGQRLDYTQDCNSKRKDSVEMKEREEFEDGIYQQFREAAEAHRRVRTWARKWIAPGMKMIDIARKIEAGLRTAVGDNGVEKSIAFPVGLSLNNCAAHYTPNSGDTLVLGKDDVLKVDLGLQVGGRIIDSAFTMAFDPKYDPLLEAVKDSTNTGIKALGVDVRVCDVGAEIQEVMESYEITLDGKTYPIKPIKGLMGHSLGIYHIHDGKSIPSTKGSGDSTKLEEGDFIALETFGSTGKGHVNDDGETSHFMRTFDPAAASMNNIRTGGAKARELLSFINHHYGTLAWAKRWLDEAGLTRYQLALKGLIDTGIVEACPPLLDIKGSYVAQFEHTVALKPTGKEVFSRGDDY